MKSKHTNLATALVAAQEVMENPKYDAVNPHFKNRYASLKAVRAAVIKPLNMAGITVIQSIIPIVGGIACETYLIHESGEQMKFGPLPVPSTKQDAQGYGSAITYACRYALCSICGVTGEDDDDAEKAVDRPSPVKPLFVNTNNQVDALIKKASQELQGGEAVIKEFLYSKKAWPEGIKTVRELDAKIVSRLLAPEVWEQVTSFAKENEI